MKETVLIGQRTDPFSGITYTFTTDQAEFENSRFSAYMTPKEFAIKFFWWTINGDYEVEDHPTLIEEARNLLPIMGWFVKDIVLIPNKTKSDPGSEKYNYSYVLHYFTDPDTSPDPTIDFSPTEDMMAELGHEVINSEALMVAMFWYLDAYRPIIEADQKAEAAKESGQSKDSKGKEANVSTSQAKKIDQKKNMMQSMHSLTQQFYVTADEVPAEERSQEWLAYFGRKVDNSINKYGIDLTEIQSRVMEGILYALSNTKYSGTIPPISKDDILDEYRGKTVESIDQLPAMYKNINHIPQIRLGKRELVKLAGMNYDSQRDVERVGQAIDYLSTTQFCFYYTRTAIGKDGQYEKDKKTNEYIKESVTSVDTLFKVKVVNDQNTQVFKYYEISPSALFLDQKDRYFMLIPFGWREEVKALVGNKKASAYLYLFLLYLRYQFEQKRRYNVKPTTKKRVPYEIKARWAAIAQALRMPESVYKRKPDRALTFLNDAYSAAKELGYLKSYSRIGLIDTLVLNPEKYPTPASGYDLQ